MIYIFVFLIVVLLSIIVYLFANNNKIKDEHAKNIQKLQEIIYSLHTKQKQLNDKVNISKEYSHTYSKDMKILGDEIVELQKVFINIISNGNNN